jgi:hypothetical protein
MNFEFFSGLYMKRAWALVISVKFNNLNFLPAATFISLREREGGGRVQYVIYHSYTIIRRPYRPTHTPHYTVCVYVYCLLPSVQGKSLLIFRASRCILYFKIHFKKVAMSISTAVLYN